MGPRGLAQLDRTTPRSPALYRAHRGNSPSPGQRQFACGSAEACDRQRPARTMASCRVPEAVATGGRAQMAWLHVVSTTHPYRTRRRGDWR